MHLKPWHRLGIRTQFGIVSRILVGLLAWGLSLYAGRQAAAELEHKIRAALVRMSYSNQA